ncbi:sigma factor-like helix-turn-helix DNA-binding protein [Atrimonas thermophila]|uniref:sigma factor-like helix-turn-helix DNA-binding protein n=1 Tax=Atrimonas thermophila TaxID=3064161 RepID=UPI00399C4D32
MLTRKEHFILEMRRAGLSRKEIGRLVGVTEYRIRQIEERAMRKLREVICSVGKLGSDENGKGSGVCH